MHASGIPTMYALAESSDCARVGAGSAAQSSQPDSAQCTLTNLAEVAQVAGFLRTGPFDEASRGLSISPCGQALEQRCVAHG